MLVRVVSILELKVILPSLRSGLTFTLLSFCIKYYSTNYHGINCGYPRNTRWCYIGRGRHVVVDIISHIVYYFICGNVDAMTSHSYIVGFFKRYALMIMIFCLV